MYIYIYYIILYIYIYYNIYIILHESMIHYITSYFSACSASKPLDPAVSSNSPCFVETSLLHGKSTQLLCIPSWSSILHLQFNLFAINFKDKNHLRSLKVIFKVYTCFTSLPTPPQSSRMSCDNVQSLLVKAC